MARHVPSREKYKPASAVPEAEDVEFMGRVLLPLPGKARQVQRCGITPLGVPFGAGVTLKYQAKSAGMMCEGVRSKPQLCGPPRLETH